MNLREIITAARGDTPADLVLTNARIIDVFSGEIVPGNIAVKGGYIAGIGAYRATETVDLDNRIVAPGFIDAHVHIESSMMSVTEFARTVLARGTTTVVADPHEIANVLGAEGIRYMLDSGKNQPLNIYFTLSSCVPATDMETAGARLTADDLAAFIGHDRILALAEMMNYPGVIQADPEVLRKITLARNLHKPIDGHSPGVSGMALNAYIAAGISSDHECTTAEEAKERLRAGMHIMVREGTGAKNLDLLLPAVNRHTCRRMMWCTDDRHPHDLREEGHIDYIVRRAVHKGLDPVTAIQMATINPADYFGLKDAGAIAPGRKADLLVISDLKTLHISQVYCQGRLVAQEGAVSPQLEKPAPVEVPQSMNVSVADIDFAIRADGDRIRLIEVIPDQIITRSSQAQARIADGRALSDPQRDILKIAVVDRHTGSGSTGKAFVRGLGLKKGAIASSVAHDSHNIIVAGADDGDMRTAVEAVIKMKGGLAAACDGSLKASLPLPIAGLMSDAPVEAICPKLDRLLEAAREFGCTLSDPFMTLSFLALPVIPSLKITDQGLVDVDTFSFVPLFVE
jgi:adenine deaminase